MRILLVGYGKMGKLIEEMALDENHEIVERIDSKKSDLINSYTREQVDVAIEFTQPDVAFNNIATLLSNGIPVVTGTTGWYDKIPDLQDLINKNDTALLYAPNFSIGVNVFFHLNKYLAKMMEGFGQYGVRMKEIHHTEKKDAPSGTAIRLAELILDNNSRFNSWKLGTADGNKAIIPVEALREADVKGTHQIEYSSEIDCIKIEHEAKTRKGFAEGALLAGKWIIGKRGVFTMNDVLKF